MKLRTLASAFTLLVATACSNSSVDEAPNWRAVAAAQRHEPGPRDADAPSYPTTIHDPASLTSVATGLIDASGRPVGVLCATCHSLPELVPAHALGDDRVAGPHAGLTLRHGNNSCASCHFEADPTRLRLADGTVVAMRDAMLLCAQCHGLKHSDYQRGVHGGMRGYWDLARGAREKNHCVDCHDPHAPAYPRFRPLPPPTDRFPPAPPQGEHL